MSEGAAFDDAILLSIFNKNGPGRLLGATAEIRAPKKNKEDVSGKKFFIHYQFMHLGISHTKRFQPFFGYFE
jgi:hypothetical protein